jgi:hypothetical protein
MTHAEEMLEIKPQRDSQGAEVEKSTSGKYKPNIFKRIMP